jgi:hypothetical protein
MNGNIDDWLDIVSGDTTVTVTGWIDFQPGDPNNVQIWVGVGQGDKKKATANATAVYGDGWVTVVRPAAGSRTAWQCPAIINGGGTFKNGTAEAGAVVVAGGLNPYPWGRDVKLKR